MFFEGTSNTPVINDFLIYMFCIYQHIPETTLEERL